MIIRSQNALLLIETSGINLLHTTLSLQTPKYYSAKIMKFQVEIFLFGYDYSHSVLSHLLADAIVPFLVVVSRKVNIVREIRRNQKFHPVCRKMIS